MLQISDWAFRERRSMLYMSPLCITDIRLSFSGAQVNVIHVSSLHYRYQTEFFGSAGQCYSCLLFALQISDWAFRERRSMLYMSPLCITDIRLSFSGAQVNVIHVSSCITDIRLSFLGAQVNVIHVSSLHYRYQTELFRSAGQCYSCLLFMLQISDWAFRERRSMLYMSPLYITDIRLSFSGAQVNVIHVSSLYYRYQTEFFGSAGQCYTCLLLHYRYQTELFGSAGQCYTCLLFALQISDWAFRERRSTLYMSPLCITDIRLSFSGAQVNVIHVSSLHYRYQTELFGSAGQRYTCLLFALQISDWAFRERRSMLYMSPLALQISDWAFRERRSMLYMSPLCITDIRLSFSGAQVNVIHVSSLHYRYQTELFGSAGQRYTCLLFALQISDWAFRERRSTLYMSPLCITDIRLSFSGAQVNVIHVSSLHYRYQTELFGSAGQRYTCLLFALQISDWAFRERRSTLYMSPLCITDIRLSFSGAQVNVIHVDQGATNGMMHIVDNILFVNEDLTRDISASSMVKFNYSLLIVTLLIFLFVRKRDSIL